MSAILLIVIPLLAAFIAIIVKKLAPYLLILVGLFNVVLLFFLNDGFYIIGGFDQPLGINLLVDMYARLGLILVNALILVIAVLNFKAYEKFASVMLLAMAGLSGLMLTNDLFNLFVFLEISGIAAYLISASNKKLVSTFHYLVLGAIGSSLFLFGLIILYAMFGTLNMVDMIEKIQAVGNYQQLILPFSMMFIGLGVEAKLLPFNAWVKGVLGNSNTLSGPMIAGVYAAAMSFVLGRLITNLFAFEGTLLMVVTIILVVGIILGDVMAFASRKTREILLFSSVAQASIVALLFVNGIIIWAVYLIVANAVSKTVLFLVINKATKEVGSDETHALQGLFAHNKVVGVTFTIAALSVMGLPLFVGFNIKLNFLMLLADYDHIWLVVLILVASVIEGIYFIKLLVKLWYKGEHDIQVKYHWSFKIVFVVIGLALVVLGVYITPLYELNDLVDHVRQVMMHG